MKHALAYIAAAILGMLFAVVIVKSEVRKAYSQGYDAGFASTKPTIKQLVLDQPKYVSSICRSWWFDMTTKERQL